MPVSSTVRCHGAAVVPLETTKRFRVSVSRIPVARAYNNQFDERPAPRSSSDGVGTDPDVMNPRDDDVCHIRVACMLACRTE